MTPEQRKSYAQALGGQKSGATWTNIPPARTGRQVEGASILPLGMYEMPDGSHQVSWGLPQGALDAYRSMRYGLGFEQDPDAPDGYVSEGAISRGAWGAAGMAATGGIAATTASRAAGRSLVPDNSVGMFAGVKSKTANRAALSQAQRMADDGRSAADIWKSTWDDHGQGWFRGADGKWAHEISDDLSVLNKNVSDIYSNSTNGYQGHLNKAITHKELFDAYPGLANAEVSASKQPLPGGAFRRADADGPSAIDVEATSAPEARSLLLHEIQHAIEDAEGWSRGGGMGTYKEHMFRGVRDEIESLSREIKKLSTNADDASKAKMKELNAKRFDLHSKYISDLAEFNSNPNRNIDAHEYYKRLKGEVLARATEARKDLTPQQRRVRPPWEDYDVPENNQVLNFYD